MMWSDMTRLKGMDSPRLSNGSSRLGIRSKLPRLNDFSRGCCKMPLCFSQKCKRRRV